MKLFISWAKDEAKEIALELHQWIPSITLQRIQTWCSADSECLPHGQGFPEKILTAAKDCDACLAILTKQNLSSWWINFETGIFFGQNKKVFALLCGDLTYQTLAAYEHPLSANGMNYTHATPESIVGLFKSLNQESYEWKQIDFKTPVEREFNRFNDKYISIFNEGYIRLSNLLTNDINNKDFI